MKKLLVLMLVLGMASLANATMLTFSLDGGGTDVQPNTSITINVTADVGAQSFELGGITIAGDFSNLATGSVHAGFDLAHSDGLLDDGSPSNVWIRQVGGTVNATGGSPDVAAGQILYSFTMTSGAAGNTITIDALAFMLPPPVYVQLNTHDVDPAALALNIVPEPMTIALLGLGGLFLRRRK